jgi:hypothetical protein
MAFMYEFRERERERDRKKNYCVLNPPNRELIYFQLLLLIQFNFNRFINQIENV